MSCSTKLSFIIKKCKEEKEEIEESESPPESESICFCVSCGSEEPEEEKSESQSACASPAPPDVEGEEEEEEVILCCCTTCTQKKAEKTACSKKTPPPEPTICCCTTCTEKKPEKKPEKTAEKTACSKKTPPPEPTICCCAACTEKKAEKPAGPKKPLTAEDIITCCTTCTQKVLEETVLEKSASKKETPPPEQSTCACTCIACTEKKPEETACTKEKTPPKECPSPAPLTVIICNMPGDGSAADKKEKKHTDDDSQDNKVVYYGGEANNQERDENSQGNENSQRNESSRRNENSQKNKDSPRDQNSQRDEKSQKNENVQTNQKDKLDWTPIKKSNVPIVWILGKPGTGKDTQAESIVSTIPGFVHISTGDLLRGEIKTGSTLGQCIDVIMKQGLFVPTDIVKELLLKKMLEDLSNTKAFLIDGYPRDKEQADQFVKDTKKPKKIIYLDAPDEVIVNRLKRRGQSSNRPDDNEETIRKRLIEANAHDEPLLKAYKNDITKIDTNKAPKDVFPDLRDALIDVHPSVGYLP